MFRAARILAAPAFLFLVAGPVIGQATTTATPAMPATPFT